MGDLIDSNGDGNPDGFTDGPVIRKARSNSQRSYATRQRQAVWVISDPDIAIQSVWKRVMGEDGDVNTMDDVKDHPTPVKVTLLKEAVEHMLKTFRPGHMKVTNEERSFVMEKFDTWANRTYSAKNTPSDTILQIQRRIVRSDSLILPKVREAIPFNEFSRWMLDVVDEVDYMRDE